MTTTDIARDNSRIIPASRAARNPVSPRRAARIAGIGYMAIFVLAIFANFVVREGMVEPDNAAATVANISESIGLFRLGMIAFLVIFLVDIVVAWALHVVLREVHHDVSLGAAWFRIVYTVFLGVALVFFFQVLQLLGDGGMASALTADQINVRTMVAVESFNYVWLIGLAAFGVHLVMVGYLLLRSGYVSRVLGYILIAAGIAYGLDTVANTLLGNYSDYSNLFQIVVVIPSVIGEGWLGLWLLLGGRRLASDTVRPTLYTPSGWN
jgi:hypothetical protein